MEPERGRERIQGRGSLEADGRVRAVGCRETHVKTELVVMVFCTLSNDK